jgi:hypothetical protein
LPTSVLVCNSKALVVVIMWTKFAAFALLTQHVASQNINVGRLLRFSCSQLVIERTDPLVNPGMNPSTHVHQIVGGNSFNVTVSSLARTCSPPSLTSPDGPRPNGPLCRIDLHNLYLLRRLQQLLDRQLVLPLPRKRLIQTRPTALQLCRHRRCPTAHGRRHYTLLHDALWWRRQARESGCF